MGSAAEKNMIGKRIFLGVLTAVGCILGAAAPAALQACYLSRLITLIVPFGAGGPVDTLARTLIEPMRCRSASRS